jgi:hypothetical protein
MLGFVAAVLTIQAIPCMAFARQAISGIHFVRWSALAIALIGGLSLAVALVPMGLGLRAIRRLEI